MSRGRRETDGREQRDGAGAAGKKAYLHDANPPVLGTRTGRFIEIILGTCGGAVMRSAISALAGLALAGSFALAQPSDGRLKIIHETATLRVANRTDSRPFSYVDAQGRPVGYTIELCERIA